jgi:hypothetical protein
MIGQVLGEFEQGVELDEHLRVTSALSAERLQNVREFLDVVSHVRPPATYA